MTKYCYSCGLGHRSAVSVLPISGTARRRISDIGREYFRHVAYVSSIADLVSVLLQRGMYLTQTTVGTTILSPTTSIPLRFWSETGELTDAYSCELITTVHSPLNLRCILVLVTHSHAYSIDDFLPRRPCLSLP